MLFVITGPVASVLVKKLGCRITEIAGGVCLIIGIGVSSLSSEAWHAYILLSVLAGKSPVKEHISKNHID